MCASKGQGGEDNVERKPLKEQIRHVEVTGFNSTKDDDGAVASGVIWTVPKRGVLCSRR